MKNKKLIEHLRILSWQIMARINARLAGGYWNDFEEGALHAYATSAALLASNAGIATMVWDRPAELKQAA